VQRVFNSLAAAMAIATVVIAILGSASVTTEIILLSVGLLALALANADRCSTKGK
jgi:hypothetical protein